MSEITSSHQLRFQCSLRRCYEQMALINANHDSYIHFIDDLKKDLDSLSFQVNLTREQFNTDESAEESGYGEVTEGTTEDTTEDSNDNENVNEEGADGDGPTIDGVSEEATLTKTRRSSGDCDADADADTTDDTYVQALSWHDFEGEKESTTATTKKDLLEEMDQQIEQKSKVKTPKTTKIAELEKNIESLKYQVEQLQRNVCEKDKRISQLNAMLSRLSHIHIESEPTNNQVEEKRQQHQQQQVELEGLQQRIAELQEHNQRLTEDLNSSHDKERFLLNEARKLNMELMESKRKHSDISAQASRLIALLRTQEDQRLELSRRYEEIEDNYVEQQKKLQIANAHLNQLQERYMKFEKRSDENNMERNLLRQEVLCLKEKEGAMMNKQKAIHEQLVKAETELCTAHEVIKEQQRLVQHNDTTHREVIRRMQEANIDTKRKYNILVDDYNKLQEEYEKQIGLQERNEKVIESFRKWKEAQIKSDEATRASFMEYEDHIKLLLEEKQMFLERYRELKRDYTIMQNELDRLRGGACGTLSPFSASDNSFENRIEHIRRTSRRVSEKCTSLQDVGEEGEEEEEESTELLGLCKSKSAQDLFKHN